MISLNVAKLLAQAGGTARLRRLLRKHQQPVPQAAAVAQWKARNTLPRKWMAPVLYVLAREGVDPLSIMDVPNPTGHANDATHNDDPFADADADADTEAAA